MIALLRRYTASLLMLALVLTGHQAAYARGLQPAVGEMVICVGQTVVTVRIDADGQPVKATHLCPDIAVTLFVAEAGGFAPATPEAIWIALVPFVPPVSGTQAPEVQPQARGPPRVV